MPWHKNVRQASSLLHIIVKTGLPRLQGVRDLYNKSIPLSPLLFPACRRQVEEDLGEVKNCYLLENFQNLRDLESYKLLNFRITKEASEGKEKV